ncbi:MAG: pitrilysin family protein [bacterium]
MLMRVFETVLENGVRVVTAEMPHVESVSLGFWARAGGRDEAEALSGISHFIEHLLFKGTPTRTARAISQAVEGRGGYLNAFTQEESTCYYARVEAAWTWETLEVLGDMYRHALLAEDEIERERGVILEEIAMYRDQPQQLVEEILGEQMWRGHAVGRPLTGTPETVAALRRRDFKAYLARHYQPAGTVVTFAGRVEHADCVEHTRKMLRGWRAAGEAPRFAAVTPRVEQTLLCVRRKEVEQVNIALGVRLFGRRDRRRYAMRVLSVVLGENMSSRLFQVIRERHGLAYAIQSGLHLMSDTGAFVITAGLERGRPGRAVALIARELTRVCRVPVGAIELRRAKEYAVGQLRLSLESTTPQMNWTGEQAMAGVPRTTPEDEIAALQAVTTAEVLALAQTVFTAPQCSLAVVAPEIAPAEARAFREAIAGLGQR